MDALDWTNIRYFEAYVGGFMGKSFLVKLEKGETSIDYKVYSQGEEMSPLMMEDFDLEKYRPTMLNEQIWSALYDGLAECGLERWKDKYEMQVLDGTGWHVVVRFEDGSKLIKVGNNAYPRNWKSFCRLMQRITGREFE